VGVGLPVKARLVRANNQWGMDNPPLIKVSLYRKNARIDYKLSTFAKKFDNTYG